MFESGGRYIIKSLFVRDGGDLGQRESIGPSPRPIIAFPEGSRPGVFEIRPVGEEIYVIFSEPDNALVGEFRDQVYAFVTPTVEQKWRIIPQPQAGPHIYSIQRMMEPLVGWLLPDDQPDTQVAVGLLPATKTIPPQILPPGLFQITPIFRD